MAATDAQVERLRRMTGEVDSETYSDEDLAEYIERYPLEDARGEGPWIESESDPGTLEENPDWIATYCLNAAAAAIWQEKAADMAANYDFDTDGGKFSRSQAYEQTMKQARYYASRRAIKTITQELETSMEGEDDV